MRLILAATLIAGALLGKTLRRQIPWLTDHWSFGIGEVAATPVVITLTSVSNTESVPQGMRLGHAVPLRPISPAGTVSTMRRPCKARLAQKGAEISNAFREFFGLPLIKTIDAPGRPADDGRVHILPFIGTPPAFIETGAKHGEDSNDGKHHGHYGHHGHHGHHKHHGHKKGRGSFMQRLQISLLALGPWEGRAVAFVLGKCQHLLTDVI